MDNNDQVEKKFQEIEEKIIKEEEIEIAAFTFLHPSLDIKNELAVFGFRVTMKDGKPGNVFLIAKGDKPELTRSTTFEHKGKEYRIDLRNRLLEPLEERWGFEDLKRFVENPQPPANPLWSVHEILKKYTQLPNETDYLLLAAWIVGTYLFPAFWSYPFFNPKAPKGSGKSQLQNLLLKLCFNAKKARPTLAAFADTVDALRGTYIIDQADGLHNPNKEEIREILTDSYVYEGGKRRLLDMSKKGERRVIEFETYAPKVFGSQRELPEDLRDRCIFIPMLRSPKNFPPPSEQNENWKMLRGNNYKFVILKFSAAQRIYQQALDAYRSDPKIVGRVAELWVPLESILKLCDVEQEKIEGVKDLFLQRYGFTEYRPNEQEEIIVLAIKGMFDGESTITVSPKEIAQKVPEFGLDDEDKKKLPQTIGRLIKKFNLSVEAPKRGGKGMKHTISKNMVDSVVRSYFSTGEIPVESTQAFTDEELQRIDATLGVQAENDQSDQM